MTIGIVNDVPLAIEALKRALALAPAHRVVWIATNGLEAVQKCAVQRPDLVLMDLLMPQMDGVEATRRIMQDTPCAILIVTVSVGANSNRVFQAMGHGALDAVDTPPLGTGDLRQNAAHLLAKIETIGRLIAEPAPAITGTPSRAPFPRRPRLIAIGASAGGPAAVATLLRGLPPRFPGALVVVQHVDEQFATGMASWLHEQSKLPVRVAAEGDTPTAGTVLLAGTADHLTLGPGGRLHYTREPVEHIHRPSVDVFFESVTQHCPFDAIGILLTGMGRDGAVGLRTLRNKGHYTIAQDRATSAVYGMPKAAAALNAAIEILPLPAIAPRLVALTTPAVTS